MVITVAAKADTPVRMVTTRAKRLPVPLGGVSEEKMAVDMLRGVRTCKLDARLSSKVGSSQTISREGEAWLAPRTEG